MHFGSLAYYRKWENAVLGDPNDGEGMFMMNGHRYEVGSINPVYAWCASLPTVTSERINKWVEPEGYDRLVRVCRPLVLI